jgi:hypothetical protein
MNKLGEIKELLNFPMESQLHILKHFNFIDNKYKNYLLSSFSEEIIKSSLKIIGSTFYENFCSNPIQLLDILMSKYITQYWHDKKTKKHYINFQFTKEEYPEGIGYDNLISLDILPTNVLKKLTTTIIDGTTIKSVSREKITTWEVNIILISQQNNYFVVTIFPGKHAPPFPNNKIQSKEQFKESTLFWENHAFIK